MNKRNYEGDQFKTNVYSDKTLLDRRLKKRVVNVGSMTLNMTLNMTQVIIRNNFLQRKTG